VGESITILFGLALSGIAAAMLVQHVRVWRMASRDTTLNAAERDFRQRQFRRRMQSSGMLGVIGLLIVVAQVLMSLRVAPWLSVGTWGIILILLLWLCLLALADILATQAYFGRQRQEVMLEQTKLRAQMRLLKRRPKEEPTPSEHPEQSNGKHRIPPAN